MLSHNCTVAYHILACWSLQFCSLPPEYSQGNPPSIEEATNPCNQVNYHHGQESSVDVAMKFHI